MSADAFGRIDGFTGDGWQSNALYSVSVSGIWAVLTTIAVATTVCTVGVHFRVRSQALSYLVMASSAAVALFVLLALLYLNSKAPELQSLTLSARTSGLGTLVNLFLGSDSTPNLGAGEHRIASAGLDLAAALGGITAFGAALAAIATGLRRHTGGSARLVWSPGAPRSEAAPADRISQAEQPVHTLRVDAAASPLDHGDLLWEQLVFDSDLVAYDTPAYRCTAHQAYEAADLHPVLVQTVVTR